MLSYKKIINIRNYQEILSISISLTNLYYKKNHNYLNVAFSLL
jgi:hypothetical protein